MEITNHIDITNYCDLSNNVKPTPKRYTLKGFSSHSGTGNGGHYTADCVCPIDNKTWYNYNDTSVNRYINAKKPEDLNTHNAYVLMYELDYTKNN